MGSQVFWRRAVDEPGWIAAIEPDGTAHTAGDLLARVNQLTHGLRERGLRPGDGLAILAPNGIAALEVYLAALQSGWYLTPINWHFTVPEVAYILRDSEAKVFLAHERFADAAAGAADEAGIADGGHHDALHLGHHRPPQGRTPPAIRPGPRRRRRTLLAAAPTVRHHAGPA